MGTWYFRSTTCSRDESVSKDTKGRIKKEYIEKQVLDGFINAIYKFSKPDSDHFDVIFDRSYKTDIKLTEIYFHDNVEYYEDNIRNYANSSSIHRQLEDDYEKDYVFQTKWNNSDTDLNEDSNLFILIRKRRHLICEENEQ